MINRFILGDGVVIYFIMQSFFEKKQNKTKKKKTAKAAVRHLILSTARSSYYTCENSLLILSVFKYLLLNKLRAGIFISVTTIAVVLGCSNMKGSIIDKWCWSADTDSCTLA